MPAGTAKTSIWKGISENPALSGPLVATAESGGFKFAERITYMEQLAGRYMDAFIYANAHHRGSIWTVVIGSGVGATAGSFCVEDCSLDSAKGGKGVVTVNYLYLGLTPPDEFSVTPFEITPAIERNGYFSALTQDDLKKARGTFNAASAIGQTSIVNAIDGTTNKVLTKALVNKWLKGEETFYLAGLKFQHTLYSFVAPSASLGGIIQFPFGAFAGYVSSAGMSWLRQSDEVIWSNGVWKLTRTWLGAPNGHWDTDLYPAG